MREIGGPNVEWGSQSMVDLLIAERRFQSEQIASRRNLRATWALAVATVVLALATVGLIIATVNH